MHPVSAGSVCVRVCVSVWLCDRKQGQAPCVWVRVGRVCVVSVVQHREGHQPSARPSLCGGGGGLGLSSDFLSGDNACSPQYQGEEGGQGFAPSSQESVSSPSAFPKCLWRLKSQDAGLLHKIVCPSLGIWSSSLFIFPSVTSLFLGV